MRLNIYINGAIKSLDVEPGDMLLDALQKYGYRSVKESCDTGACGVCTVLLDGKPIPSCSYLALKAEGRNITTVEGVKEEAERFAKFMIEEGAVQCGFCSPGFTLTVIAMKRELVNPKDEDINHYLAGNLCRCSGYEGQLWAVKKYMEVV